MLRSVVAMFSYDAAFGPVVLGISLCLIAFAYFWWWHRLKRRFPTPVSVTQVSASEFDELERSIGGNLPAAMRTAYLDGKVTYLRLPITFQCHGMEFVVVGFISASAQSNKRLVRSIGFREGIFIFASDDFGNYYFLKASEDAIYFWDHDGDDITKLFESTEDFWKALQ